ncbi:MAG: metallophosphoesterase family protein [bacterium]
MKTIIFSDTHLKQHFENKKFQFLKTLCENADRIIINGDFYDGYYLSCDQFLQSKWQQLFPILKTKQTVYIAGNHDPLAEISNKALVFATQIVAKYQIVLNEKTLVIEHGNRVFKSKVERFPFLNNFFTRYVNEMLDAIIFNPNLPKFLKNLERKKLQRDNAKIKKIILPKIAANQIFVCGHTHLAEFLPEQNFINTGYIDYHQASYLEIIDQKLCLVVTSY